MNTLLVTVSIVLFAVGGILGFVPLSVLNSVSLNIQPVACSSPNNCVATIQLTNINATSGILVYFSVYNAKGQSAIPPLSQAFSSSTSTVTVKQDLGTLPNGKYTLNVFALSSTGYAVSTTQSANFGTGLFNLVVLGPGGGASVSASPSGNSVASPCGSGINCPSGTIAYAYPYGTQVTVTFTNSSSTVFDSKSCWQVIDQITGGATNNCKNPLALTMNSNYQVLANSDYSASQFYYNITPSVFQGGSVSPSSPVKIYFTSAGGPTSATFTETPQNGWNFTNWVVPGTSFKNTSKTLVLTANMAANIAKQQSGVANINLVAQFSILPTLTIQNLYPGVTTNPTAGTYPEPPNSKVTITETTTKGYCFVGWATETGKLANSTSVTITMDTSHSITPITAPTGSASCKAGGGSSGGSGGQTNTNPILAIPFFGVGAITLIAGLRRRR